MAHQVEYAQFVRQCPCLRFVYPHQGGMDNELLVHGKVERDVERLDERVPAIGIAAEVGLRYARHEMPDAPLTGIYGGDAQEEQVAPGYERIWEGVFGFRFVHRYGSVGERVFAQLPDKRHVHHIEMHFRLPCDFACDFHFLHVLLPVEEAECIHFLEM